MNASGKLNRFSSFSIIIVFIILILTGIPLVYLLNFKLYPNTRSSSLSVNFSWNNAEPRLIEEKVTSKLEALIVQIQGIKRINSRSGNRSGRITVTLDKNVDIDAVRFQISSLIRQLWAELPDDISYPQLSATYPDHENERPVLSYTLSAPTTPSRVREYAEDHIKTSLSAIKGIHKIEINGGSSYSWVIAYDNDKMDAMSIRPDEIRYAVTTNLARQNLGIGYYSRENGISVKDAENEFVDGLFVPVIIQTSFSGYHLQDIEKTLLSIPVKRKADRVIYLSDIAKIWYKEDAQSSLYRINGLNTINILVYPGEEENNLVLAKKTRLAVQQLQNGLPAGYELLLGEDSTRYISHELQNILIRSLFAFTILLLFILLATRKWKYALLVLFMLIGNLSIAIIFYYVFNLELHLYALAGITVSFGLMTDNIIIMSDHFRRHGNRKAFLAILAGTMAVISSLLIIFFLDEQVKANLVDFAMVIMINQSVSLFTALFVIPALADKMGLTKAAVQAHKYDLPQRHKLEHVINFTVLYMKAYRFIYRKKAAFIIILILGFGTPVYLLPDKWDGDKWFNKIYNSSIGNQLYKTNMKPVVDKYLGGALRLFTEKVYSGSYFSNPEETNLFISATFPRGSTMNQADALITRMEDLLKQYKEISIFRSNISPGNSSITIYFDEKYRRSEFPFILKAEVVNRAVELGGAYWSVRGFGDAFNNTIYETTGNYAIKVNGYNFDRLMLLATNLKADLAKYERVKEIFVVSERSWYKPDNTEFIAQVNPYIPAGNIDYRNTYNSLQDWSINPQAFTDIINGTKRENIRLIPEGYPDTDLWKLSKLPFHGASGIYRFGNTFTITRQTTSAVISREDQQYIMFLQFEFTGADKSARSYINNTLESFKHQVPIGYNVSLLPGNRFLWGDQDKDQYWFLFLVIIIIFFICSILFESLSQPFAVILIIPVSYIGIFLTFYIFRLNFDQGGFAALLMLCGLTVNSAIYILNDFNNLKGSRSSGRPNDIRLYFKAFNYKIIPILLTVVSTILGFVPFLIGEKQTFWYALAAGTIGGLIFSLIGIVFFLPLFLGLKDNQYKKIK
jgi:multidrug efflux pump subunit AcrB